MKQYLNMTLSSVLAVFCGLLALAAPLCLGGRRRYVAAANTYDAAVEVHDGKVTRTNDAAVAARHLLWKQGSTDGGVALCGVTDIALGTIDNLESGTGARQSILLLGKGCTKKMVVNEAVTAGERVFQAASGKVQDLPAGAGTYLCVGVALTAGAADGDIIEVNDCAPYSVVVS